ncbi:MAG: hypothetical protein PHT69_02430 [Bacteroidales bacterium]|nr:hypothetical protein [Bacteroidales bacterium]
MGTKKIVGISKLVTDEMIEKKYPELNHFTQEDKIKRAYLIEGAKWMRDEMTGSRTEIIVIWDGGKETFEYLTELNNKYKEKFPKNPARFDFLMDDKNGLWLVKTDGLGKYSYKMPLHTSIILETIVDNKMFIFSFMESLKPQHLR